jgi:hypothetical protein
MLILILQKYFKSAIDFQNEIPNLMQAINFKIYYELIDKMQKNSHY